MNCVLLDITSNGLQVISTDCHRMYLSKQYDLVGNGEDMQLLLSAESVKQIAAMKVKNETINIELLPTETVFLHMATKFDEHTKEYVDVPVMQDVNCFLFNGLKVGSYSDMKFPNYKVVIPEYKTKMQFNRKQMISSVETVSKAANKTTKQVNFHLNGNIQLSSQDVDFGYENSLNMPYISKDFKDTDIAFNGRFMIEALKTFNSTEISMYSEGIPTKASIFTDGSDNVLLMPLMMNN